MKKIVLSIGILALATAATAQKKGKTTASEAEKVSNPSTLIYSNAMKYGDASTAIMATHQLIAEQGENSTYKDSLAMLYFNSNQTLSCHLLCKELLTKRNTDTTLLVLNAASLKNLGANKEAIAAYESLFALTKNRYHAYELAQLQYGIARLAESLVSINQALNNTAELEGKITFAVDKEKTQQVPLNAALYNLKGMVAYELKDEKSAVEAFDEALKIMPDFEAAKLNKSAIEALKTKK
ncbi:MAG: hypothetical protein RL264_3005 [Bacteroidota bacterium]|jgi:tetratricopeptide (TPR) repeat protein